MGLGHSPRIVTDGLVLCLDAANARSYPGTGTTWTDRSTNGNNGTLTNQAQFNSANGGVIDLDGTDDYIDVGSDLISGTNNKFTISFWIVPDSLTGFNQNVALCGWGSNGIGGNGLVIYFAGSQSSSKVWVQKNANGQNTLNLNAYAPTIGEWFNWVYTSDTSSNQQISYINGKYLSSQTAGAAPGSSGSLRFGASQTSEKGDLNGRMNNLMFYNRALTSEEVRQNFEATKGRYE